MSTRIADLRTFYAAAPRRWGVLPWLGPGLLWMVSAVGSGAVLFTPRVAARYEYDLLWLGLIVCFLMWVMIREAARYSVVTGHTLFEGFAALPGPKGWALWVIFLPQLLAAVVGVAGLSALVGSALRVSVGGDHTLWALATIGLATLLVTAGGYQGVARAAQVMAGVLVSLSVVAAAQVFPGDGSAAEGLVPGVPSDLDAGFVLPWVGTILAGSMGIVWYAYWTAAKGFGGTVTRAPTPEEAERPELELEVRLGRARRWTLMSNVTAALGVTLGAVVIGAFTVLGSELLAPEGLVPSGVDVARDLARLLEDVWGGFGFWALIVTTIFALAGSVVANQDGWSRSFADITRLLVEPWLSGTDQPRWMSAARLRLGFAMVVTGLIPAAVVVAVSDPVAIMTASGVVAATHTPFIVLLILLVNRRHLHQELRPGPVAAALLGAAGLFYLAFALVRFLV